MRVDFYHLTRHPVERVLPRIAERLVGEGARLLIVADSEEARTKLDQALWSHAPDSFLPHGIAGGEDDARQPVLIARQVDPANGARNVALADGVWRDEALGFDRAFHLFGEDDIEAARVAWRALSGKDGVERNYWRQTESGGWEKAA